MAIKNSPRVKSTSRKERLFLKVFSFFCIFFIFTSNTVLTLIVKSLPRIDEKYLVKSPASETQNNPAEYLS